MSNTINDHKTPGELNVHSGNQGEWKIQLSMKINFISSKDSNEICTMHTKSANIRIMMGSKTDEIIKELFEPLLQRYQKGLEEKMRGNEFVFDSVDLLYYHLKKISPKSGGSNLDFPKWLKIKKQQQIQKNNDGNCFQYALSIALHYKNIKNNPERISKIKPFINH